MSLLSTAIFIGSSFSPVALMKGVGQALALLGGAQA